MDFVDITALGDSPDHCLSLLEGIPFEKHAAVLRCLDAHVSRFRRGDLLASNATVPLTRFLVKGSARIVRYSASGDRTILGDYQAGSLVSTDLTPLFFIEGEADIVANEPCTTLDFLISKDVEGCACCVKYVNTVRRNIMKSLARANMQFVKRIDMLSCRTAREKVLAYLEAMAEEKGTRSFSIPFNRQELADYLCIERSALSRELGRMKADGLIDFEKNRFSLKGREH